MAISCLLYSSDVPTYLTETASEELKIGQHISGAEKTSFTNTENFKIKSDTVTKQNCYNSPVEETHKEVNVINPIVTSRSLNDYSINSVWLDLQEEHCLLGQQQVPVVLFEQNKTDLCNLHTVLSLHESIDSWDENPKLDQQPEVTIKNNRKDCFDIKTENFKLKTDIGSNGIAVLTSRSPAEYNNNSVWIDSGEEYHQLGKQHVILFLRDCFDIKTDLCLVFEIISLQAENCWKVKFLNISIGKKESISDLFDQKLDLSLLYYIFEVRENTCNIIVKHFNFCKDFKTGRFIPMALSKASNLERKNHGFPLSILVGKPDPKFLCSYCKLLLRNPIQSYCGHRFCKQCIQNLVSEGTEITCPLCREEETENEYSILKLEQTFPDNAIKRELKQLPAHCNNHGCTWKGTLQKYEDHEKSCLHKRMRCPKCGDDILESETEKHQQECTALASDDTLRKQVVSMRQQLSNIEAKLEQLMQGGMSGAGGLSTDIGALKQTVGIHDEALKAYQDMFIVMSREVERNTNIITKLQQELNESRQKYAEQEEKLRTMERDLAVKGAALTDLNQKIEVLDYTSYDGVLVWKIEDFARRRDEARGGQRTSLYSPPFYTSRTGYKMCARIYLNGDGVGKGNHISLFFVVMRGRYDNLLRWPFRQKVTLTLIDQSPNSPEHVVDAFRPDPNSTSFKKPTTQMNIASGCPLFMQLPQLDNQTRAYVKDDTMFVKVVVDLTDL